MRHRAAGLLAAAVAAGALAAIPIAQAGPADGVGTWSGRPTGIAGTARYHAGEWIHTDYVFDDYGADTTPTPNQPQVVSLAATAGDFRYPEGDRYRSNAADIVEVRARIVRGDDLQVRVLLSTLVDADVPALWVAVGDQERVVTAADAAVDVGRNLLTFELPDAARGDHTTLNVGAGLHDGAGDLMAGQPGSAYMEPEAFTTGGPTDARLFDLAFNTEALEGRGGAWNEDTQSAQLHAGDLAPFAQTIDLQALRGRTTTPVTVGPGYHVRVFESRQALGEGVAESFPQYRSRFQPYAFWVPEGHDPMTPAPLFLSMHSLSVHHNQYRGGDRPGATYATYYEQFGDANDAIVVTPLGRGPDGWYEAEGLVDTLEVWADVLQRFQIDRESVLVGGYSMGGYGTYRLTTLMPDAFAGAVVLSGPMTNGVEPSPQDDPSVDNTYNQLESARHVPTYITHGTNDELVPVAGVAAQADRYGQLGHEYRFALYPGHGHLTMPFSDHWEHESAWLGAHHDRRTAPGRVTLAVRPEALLTGTGEETAPVISALVAQLAAEVGADVDGGYWVEGVVVDPEAPDGIGRVDLTSGRLAVREATAVTEPGVSPEGPFLRTGADQHETAAAGENRLTGTVSGVRELTVDVARAGLGLDARISIDTPTDLVLHLVEGPRRRTIRIAGDAG